LLGEAWKAGSSILTLSDGTPNKPQNRNLKNQKAPAKAAISRKSPHPPTQRIISINSPLIPGRSLLIAIGPLMKVGAPQRQDPANISQTEARRH